MSSNSKQVFQADTPGRWTRFKWAEPFTAYRFVMWCYRCSYYHHV